MLVIDYNTYVIDYMLSKVFKIILKAFQEAFWPLVIDYILW